MDRVSISEFLHLAQLSAADFVIMLENGELELHKSERGEILIDIASVSVESIARRRRPLAPTAAVQVMAHIEEEVASEVVQQLDEMIAEAMEIALRWQSEITPDTSKE